METKISCQLTASLSLHGKLKIWKTDVRDQSLINKRKKKPKHIPNANGDNKVLKNDENPRMFFVNNPDVFFLNPRCLFKNPDVCLKTQIFV